ncbi:MAG: hypothetical protein R3B90_11225 [Planctomycetaceae bacterium]
MMQEVSLVGGDGPLELLALVQQLCESQRSVGIGVAKLRGTL